jgi:hypothetical protein
MQIGNVIARRSLTRSGLDRGVLSSPSLVVGIAIQVAFSWAALYFAPLADVLGTGPVDLDVYALAWLGAPLLFLADFARKRLLARGRKGT